MKINKKLFKHGGSSAVVMPAEFVKRLDSDELTLELSIVAGEVPQLTITPADSLDTIENDPIFALFIEALFRDAMKHPEHLIQAKDIWDESALKLIEGVPVDDEE